MRTARRFSVILSLLFGLLATIVDAQGPVGHWPLDGDGTDISGNNLNGTLNGDVVPTADRTGATSAALRFGGAAADYVDVPDNPLLQITGAITLASWAYLTSPSTFITNNSRIVAKAGGGGQRSWSLNVENLSGGITKPGTFQIAVNANTNMSLLTTGPVPINQWFHIAGVFRPGQAMEIYLNGRLNNTSATGVLSQHGDNGLSVWIGNRHGANNTGWTGDLDDVRVYNRALSASEILALASTVPSTPTLTRAQGGNGSVKLDWEAATGLVSGYRVYQSETAGGPYTLATSTTLQTATITGLTNGTPYFFVVTAYNDTSETGYSNELSATPTEDVSLGARRWEQYGR